VLKPTAADNSGSQSHANPQSRPTLSLPEAATPSVADLQQKLKDRGLEIERLRSRLAALEGELEQQHRLSVTEAELKAAKDDIEKRRAALAASELEGTARTLESLAKAQCFNL